MISYLSGKIIVKKVNWIVLDVRDVGYKIYTLPTQNFEIDQKVNLFIFEHIKEDKDDFYGFISFGQLEIFEILLSVSGLGPKIAISILSMMNKTEIEKAIEESDIKAFTAIKGVGKKLAAKIILELRSKIELQDLEDKSQINTNNELEQALNSLGFKNKEIIKILDKMPKDLKDTEEQIKWALKNN